MKYRYWMSSLRKTFGKWYRCEAVASVKKSWWWIAESSLQKNLKFSWKPRLKSDVRKNLHCSQSKVHVWKKPSFHYIWKINISHMPCRCGKTRTSGNLWSSKHLFADSIVTRGWGDWNGKSGVQSVQSWSHCAHLLLSLSFLRGQVYVPPPSSSCSSMFLRAILSLRSASRWHRGHSLPVRKQLRW